MDYCLKNCHGDHDEKTCFATRKINFLRSSVFYHHWYTSIKIDADTIRVERKEVIRTP